MKLTGVELRRISMPLVAPFRTSFGVESTRDILLLRAVLEGSGLDGEAEGWGESYIDLALKSEVCFTR